MRAEPAEQRGVRPELGRERRDAMLVGRMIRKHLHLSAAFRFAEVLQQPHEPPRIVARLGARHRALLVGCFLDLARKAQALELRGDPDRVGDERAFAALFAAV
jgi:hypothetical protein